MVKSLGKRSLAALLIICLLLSLLPVTQVQAAEHNRTDIKEDEVLLAGDSVINNGTNQLLIYDAEVKFFENVAVGAAFVLPADIGYSKYYVEYINFGQIYLLGQYPLTVVGGTSGKDSYKRGDGVTIKAEDPKEGYEFAKWTADGDDIQFADANSAETTFKMPGHEVTVTAIFREAPDPDHAVTVVDGTSDKDSYTENETVTITANTKPGYEFTGWTADGEGIEFADASKAETTFKMPARAVTVTANFREIPKPAYAVTVMGGSAEQKEYKADETVKITATAKEGYEFTGWTADKADIQFADAASAETTFKMPAREVTVTANFKEIPKPTYAVTVVGGTSDKDTYTEGEMVTIKATERDGAKFTGWVTTDKAITFKDAKALTTTFTMPGHAASVTATFQPLVEPYKITAGADGSHRAGSGKDLIFSCSGALEDLTGISVDGKLVDASHYSLRSGSTILTLKASYLDTLSVGTHTLRFEYKEQSVETHFTITAKDDPVKPVDPSKKGGNPGTGLVADDSASGIFAFIGLSMLLLGAFVISRKVTNQ